MGQAKNRGTREQRLAEAQQQTEPDQYFGFNRLRTKDELPHDLPEDALVCMASNIVAVNCDAVRRHSGLDLKIGDWFVSAGPHEESVVHGPYQTIEEACEFARIKYNAIRFVKLDYLS